MRRYLVALLAGAAMLFAFSDDVPVTDPVGAFPQIRTNIAAGLSHLPNYTCEERIVRYEQRSLEDTAHLYDRIRLEVAFVGSRELFGWPGVGRFEDKSIDALVGGTTGTGAFAGVPLQIFSSKLSRFFAITAPDPKGLLSYKFSYPRVQNGFVVGAGDRRGYVGFHGVFWIDPKSLNLTRLELQADEIPSTVPLSEVRVNIDYQAIRIEDKSYAVPRTAEQIMIMTTGYVTRNVTTFSNCHEFRGESTVKFENLEDENHPGVATSVVSIPEKMNVDAVLKSGLQSREPAVGDPVEAVADRDVKKGRELLLPKGAKLTGRISKIRFVDSDSPFFAIAITFHTARFEHTEAHLATVTTGLSANAKVSARPNRWMTSPSYNYVLDRLPDSTFYVRGRDLDIPRGTHLYLTTVKETP